MDHSSYTVTVDNWGKANLNLCSGIQIDKVLFIIYQKMANKLGKKQG